MSPVLSVIFINYNSEQYLKEALDSFVRYHKDLPYELIVVDNNSKDVTSLRDLQNKFGIKLILMKKNMGYGAAANRGILASRGKYIAIANPDLIFINDSATKIVEYMDSHPEVGAVIPQYLNPDMTLQPSSRKFPTIKYLMFARSSFLSRLWRKNPFTREYLGLNNINKETPQKIEAVVGAFFVLRREALNRIGLFDEDFFLFSEDTDICYRLKQKGVDVVLLPNSRVIHYHGAIRKKRKVAPRSRFWRMKGVWLFIKKHKFIPEFLQPILAIGLVMATGMDAFLDLTGIITSD